MSSKLITCLKVYSYYMIYIFCQTYNYIKYIQFFIKFLNQEFWATGLAVSTSIKGGKIFTNYLSVDINTMYVTTVYEF